MPNVVPLPLLHTNVVALNPEMITESISSVSIVRHYNYSTAPLHSYNIVHQGGLAHSVSLQLCSPLSSVAAKYVGGHELIDHLSSFFSNSNLTKLKIN